MFCIRLMVAFMVLFIPIELFSNDKIERIIFEERQIEGKIRRPQLILIKAEQRPDFSPIVMQGLDGDLNLVEYSNGLSVEKSPYSEPFQFNGTKISNFVP